MSGTVGPVNRYSHLPVEEVKIHTDPRTGRTFLETRARKGYPNGVFGRPGVEPTTETTDDDWTDDPRWGEIDRLEWSR